MKLKAKKEAPKKPPARQPFNWHYLVLLAVPFLLYAKTLGFNFVYHDDDTMIIEGGTKLEQFSIKDFLTTDAWLRNAEIELYRPLQSITYAIDHRIAGTEPWIYHLHNLLVFCLAIALLYRFLQRLKFSPQVAFYLALLYSVHFLLSHAACWIPARGDLYLVLFSLCTLLAFFNWQESKKAYWLLVSLVTFFLACLAKESGIVLLPLLALLAFLNSPGAKNIARWWWVLPFALLAGVYLWLRNGAVYHSTFVGFSALLYNLPTISEEVFKFFVPLFFSVMPAFNPVVTIGGVVIIAGLVAAIIFFRRQLNMARVLIGAAFFLLMILPSVFYKPVFNGVAYDYLDHRMFMCGIGLLIIGGEFLRLAVNRFGDKTAIGIYALVAGMAACSFMYAENYRNYTSYYQNALRTNPGSGLAMINYSQFLINKEKKTAEGMQLINKAIALYPDSLIFRTIKSDYAFNVKDYALLKATADTIISKWPHQPKGYAYLGTFYLVTGSFDSAVSRYTAAIEYAPGDANNYFNRGKAHRASGKMNEAIADLKKAIELNPAFAMAYFERGNIFGNMGYFKEALNDYQQYVALVPNDATGYYYRGQAYCFSGNNYLGCADLQKAKEMGLPEAAAKLQQLCK